MYICMYRRDIRAYYTLMLQFITENIRESHLLKRHRDGVGS